MAPDTRARLNLQLVQLNDIERPALLAQLGRVKGDAADVADRVAVELELVQLSARIGRLVERLEADPQDAVLVAQGLVTAGRLVTLDFGDGAHEQYLVGDYLDPTAAIPTLTSKSPLGAALLGAEAGASVTYRTHNGPQSVTVVAVTDGTLAAA